jgi:predicted RNA-binding Zn-ribbon protein involved in translation (DUF1610 family)
MSPEPTIERPAPFPTGKRFLCPSCGSEVQIIIPSSSRHPNQVFRCCGVEMVRDNEDSRRSDGR